MKSSEVKQESSMSVNSRISMMTLAELAIYWNNEGYMMRSVSQLIAWSLDLMKDILVANGKIVATMDVRKAHEYLISRGLYQRSLKNRNQQKIATAIRFENMREQGLDPRTHDPYSYNEVHNNHSVKPSEVEVQSVGNSDYDADWEKMQEMKRKERDELINKEKEKAINIAKDAGKIHDLGRGE